MVDILKRWIEQQEGGNQVSLSTSVDEHGQEIESLIQESGLSAKEYLDRIHAESQSKCPKEKGKPGKERREKMTADKNDISPDRTKTSEKLEHLRVVSCQLGARWRQTGTCALRLAATRA